MQSQRIVRFQSAGCFRRADLDFALSRRELLCSRLAVSVCPSPQQFFRNSSRAWSTERAVGVDPMRVDAAVSRIQPGME